MSDFRWDAEVVEEWSDLEAIDALGERERETIARLGSDADCSAPFAAIHVPEWLLEEKEVEPVEGSDTIVYVRIVAASEKALNVERGSIDDWLPKSQVTVCHVGDGVVTPTKTLDSWGGA